MDRRWNSGAIVVVDVETTGLSYDKGDRVIEIGLARFEKGQLVDKWGTLINPGRHIPAEASAIHGIRDQDVADAPSFRECLQEIENIAVDAQPAAYNAQFDRGFIYGEIDDILYQGGCSLFYPAFPWLDPLVWARQIRGHYNNKLTVCCQDYGIELENAHRATDDAVAAGRLLFVLGIEIQPYTLRDMLAAQEKYKVKQDEEREAWRTKKNRT